MRPYGNDTEPPLTLSAVFDLSAFAGRLLTDLAVFDFAAVFFFISLFLS
jgi:hypothetical protein